MNDSQRTRQPLVDGAILARLREELQPDPWICDRFIHNYIRLLPARLDSLDRAMESLDSEAALDAVLSLKTSSLMVGASRLGVLAGDLEWKLRLCPPGPGPGSAPSASVFLTHLESIRDCTAGTIARLESQTTKPQPAIRAKIK
ncbi:Hpt domain-containing protein [Arthrobacter sp. ISL-5]|uniref:Hpt domain-containing protein n=1 Tax=Arthrobacter sp. ISL-5 TaxID=2819111 RepID=UPI001BE59B6C|nr:Hpt domain-containing protein [Arthrobacter sp. ISL-5]MBT2551555.1 Hpt domain-containing protein [Arthrobacter sp. ISL-5]